jgi:Kef-type K+ transport system membrane component KefB
MITFPNLLRLYILHKSPLPPAISLPSPIPLCYTPFFVRRIIKTAFLPSPCNGEGPGVRMIGYETVAAIMTEITQLFFALGILIPLAKLCGYLSTRLNQPAVLGELIAGVLIGPSLINFLHIPALFPDGANVEHTIIEMAEIGVLLLMFSAGLEIDLHGLSAVRRAAILAGILGVLTPVLMAAPVAIAFGYAPEKSIFIGLIMAATSVSISAQVMLELNVLRSREGLALLGAAVVDDVLAILLISIFLAVSPGTASASIVEVVVRLVGFLTIATAAGWFILPWIAHRVSKLAISAGVLMVAVVAALLMGVAAEVFGGVAAITGAFIAGVCLSRVEHRLKADIERGLHSINYGVFVPLFFVSIGLQADLRLLDAVILPFAFVLTISAILSKIIGAGAGGLLTGFSRLSALRLGVGMISRGEVGLIIAAIGIRSGIIQESVFAAIVLVVLVTTIITPPLVRWSFARSEPQIANVEEASLSQ